MADESETADPKMPRAPGLGNDASPIAPAWRPITVYDTVAGRVGRNGFLTREQMLSANAVPAAPEDILQRHSRIPEQLLGDAYDAAGKLPADTPLPESDMLKAIHAYASDFYDAATATRGTHDFQTMDETALLALGFLLEEAVREALGENGDMVFVEPEGLENGLRETKMTRFQIKGRVKPKREPVHDSSDGDDTAQDESPTKKRKH